MTVLSLFAQQMPKSVCVCFYECVARLFFLVCSFSEFTEQNRIRMGKKYTSIEQILFAFI